jgi:hypothetical protein
MIDANRYRYALDVASPLPVAGPLIQQAAKDVAEVRRSARAVQTSVTADQRNDAMVRIESLLDRAQDNLNASGYPVRRRMGF